MVTLRGVTTNCRVSPGIPHTLSTLLWQWAVLLPGNSEPLPHFTTYHPYHPNDKSIYYLPFIYVTCTCMQQFIFEILSKLFNNTLCTGEFVSEYMRVYVTMTLWVYESRVIFMSVCLPNSRLFSGLTSMWSSMKITLCGVWNLSIQIWSKKIEDYEWIDSVKDYRNSNNHAVKNQEIESEILRWCGRERQKWG